MAFTLSKLSCFRVDPDIVQETQWQLSKSQALVDVDDEFFPVANSRVIFATRVSHPLEDLYTYSRARCYELPIRGGSTEMQIYRNVEWFAPNGALFGLVMYSNDPCISKIQTNLSGPI